MKKSIVPFVFVPQLSKTDVAYATEDPALKPFYRYSPNLATFREVIQDKTAHVYPREALTELLAAQYSGLENREITAANIAALREETTFTICTAHQPSLFLGPLYFIYKALTTIQLAKAVEDANPGHRVVPVFVLGSEDHDLEELNHANIFGKKLVWNPEGQKGAVGSMSAQSLQPVLAELKEVLGSGTGAEELWVQVNNAYSGAKDFASATQALLHRFLGNTGLLVLNMNHSTLKRHFIPVIKEELLQQTSATLVNGAIGQLSQAGFKTQATPRDINLFYMKDGLRERIVLDGGRYAVLNTPFEFTQAEILQELELHPEHFSPNVVLRPLFQEMILPNLAYVGGGGELAYWLERKSLFEHFGVQFPMLVRRHSVLWIDKEVEKKLGKIGFQGTELFQETDALIRILITKNTETEVNLSEEKQDLKALYEQLAQKAAKVDATLENAVRAELVKAEAGFEQWESRLLRAEKQKNEVAINQLRNLKERLFPNNGLQERTDNFLPYVLKHGTHFFEELLQNLQAFETGFVVLSDVD
jgi:bacillithiol biosynthesis cysteine-adding enzyme BshC